MNYRNRHLEIKLKEFINVFKIVLLVGARQVGKSSLLANLFPNYKCVVFDPISDLYNVKKEPDIFLDNFPSPLILDEIQYVPELLPALKRRVDSKEQAGQYILTGSQNIFMLKKVSESLAGRVGIIHLDSMTLSEINNSGSSCNFWLGKYLNSNDLQKDTRYVSVEKGTAGVIWRGMLPGLLDISDEYVQPYLSSYISTYIERDVRLLENIHDLSEYNKFIRLMCALTAQEVNFSQLGREIGMSPHTSKKWLEILKQSYQWLEIPAYYGNVIKRISQKPKGHFSDTGIICNQLFISSPEALHSNPNFGNIFESWVVTNLVKVSRLLSFPPAVYHWRTNGGAEVDIVFERNSKLFPIEVKLKTTVSKNDLKGLKSFLGTYPEKTSQAVIIYTGKECMRVDRNIWAVPWNAV